MEIKYKIGDELWWPSFQGRETSVECPSCGGTGRLRIMFHDDSVESVDCPECGVGFNPPTGRIKCYDRKAEIHAVTVKGIEIDGDEAKYKTSRNYSVDEDELFDNEKDAMAAAEAKAVKYDEEERQKIFKREKDGQSWAWHAVYHRRCIKDAKRNLEYHTKKLEVANLKAGEVAKKKKTK